MLVSEIMTPDPQTVGPDDTYATARQAMDKGGFRQLPVLAEGKVVGVLTDRDLRERKGFEEQIRVKTGMAEGVITISPDVGAEKAAQLLVKHGIGGLPVVEDGVLVGVVTTTDVLRAFSELHGTSMEGVVRIDLVSADDVVSGGDLLEATRTVAKLGGDILAVGNYLHKVGDRRVYYMNIRGGNPQEMRRELTEKGYEVLRLHA